jgi:uncharacterized protein (DUF302 family)
MYERPYTLTRKIESLPMDAVTTQIKAALAAEGFGILTEIDVQATFKKKLDIDRKPYLILGACNPKLAHQALTAEPAIGTLLPCNVTVFEGDDDAIYVQAIHPAAMFSVVQNPAMTPIVEEVTARLERALAAL